MPRDFLSSFVLRVAVIWSALRLFVVGVTMSLWSPPGLVIAVGLTVTLVLIDAEVRHERVFLANLGVGRRRIVGVSISTIVLMEAALGIIAAVGLAA